MKNIEKIIHSKIIEITFLLTIIIVSFPLWNLLSFDKDFATAAFYNDVQYSYLEIEDNNSLMFPMSDTHALKNLKKTNLNVINNSKTLEEYAIILRIAKTSTLDYQCLKVAIDDEINELSNYYFAEDNENIYFIIKNGSICGEMQSYEFLMWMNEDTGNEMQRKTLNYSFEIQKNIAI